MSQQLATFERNDHIATITLNRPESLNALSGALADALTALFREVARDPDVWVLVLKAAGEKAFCVGADLKERAGFDLDDFHRNRKQIRGLFESLRAVPQPTIAAIFGFALGGGCELALSCDLIVATEGTKIGLPEARVGLLPAGGGTQLLARRVGIGRAKELIYRGTRLDVSEAQAIGLVNKVVAADALGAAVDELARDVLVSSPVAVRAAKQAIDAGFGLPLEQGLEIENDRWADVIASSDRAEGIAAFNEKRPPEWSNR